MTTPPFASFNSTPSPPAATAVAPTPMCRSMPSRRKTSASTSDARELLDADHPVGRLDNGDTGAVPREPLGELDADRTAAEDEHRRRRFRRLQDVAIRPDRRVRSAFAAQIRQPFNGRDGGSRTDRDSDMRRVICGALDLDSHRAVVHSAGEAPKAPNEGPSEPLEPLDGHPVVPVVRGLVADSACLPAGSPERPLRGCRGQNVHPRRLTQHSGTADDHLGWDASEVRALAADQTAVDAQYRPAGLGHPLGQLFAAGAEAQDDQVVSLA